MVSLKKRKEKRIRREVMIPSQERPFGEMVRMLPHRSLKASVFGPFKNPIPKKAMPSIIENIIPKETLGSNSPLSDNGPMRKEEPRQRIMARVKGFIPKRSPRMAPAKAAWDIATPTNGMRSITIHTPTIPQPIPPRIEARIALCIKV